MVRAAVRLSDAQIRHRVCRVRIRRTCCCPLVSVGHPIAVTVIAAFLSRPSGCSGTLTLIISDAAATGDRYWLIDVATATRRARSTACKHRTHPVIVVPAGVSATVSSYRIHSGPALLTTTV